MLLCVVLFINHACEQPPAANHRVLEKGKKLVMRYASGFDVHEFSWGYSIKVYDPDNESVKATYILEKASGLAPDSLDAITTPAYKIACLSTTHVPMFAALKAYDHLSALAYTSYISDTMAQKYLASQKIWDIDGKGGLDKEALLASKSEYLMVYPFEDASYSKYEDLGVELIYNAEYAEKHPLGKVEWIKFVGLLINQYDEAVTLFDSIADAYELLRKKVKQIAPDKYPSVFTGSYFKGMWNAPNGESLVAQLLEDAGAHYVFKHDKGTSGNLIFDKETFIDRVNDVPYWGRVIDQLENFNWPLSPELLAEFKAYQEHQVFYCDASASDYFGKGTLEPHIILADLIKLFHPALLPNHQPVYFKQLPATYY